MKTIIFDTEGNGNRDEEMCQLAYIIRENGEHTCKNFYFPVSSMNPYAFAVHGLSRYMLDKLSEGHSFSDRCGEIYADFSNADLLIGHNIASDIDRLNREMERCGRKISGRKKLCTMQYFNNALHLSSKNGKKKYPRLSELCDYYRVCTEMVCSTCKTLFHADESAEHDARYDATATYLCVLAAMRSGDLKGMI